MRLLQYVLLLVAAAYCFSACNNDKSSGGACTINASFDGIEKDRLLVLTNEATQQVDTFDIADGKVKFSLNLDEPRLVRFMIEGAAEMGYLYAEPGNLKLNAKKGDVQNLTVNSASHKEFMVFMNSLSPVQARLEAVTAKAQSDTANQEELLAEYEKIIAEKGRFVQQHLSKYPNSVVSANILADHAQGGKNVAELEACYKLLKGKALTCAAGKRLGTLITGLASLGIGKVAPDFEIPTVDGAKFKLSSLRGKYVLIDFWASWCRPCREENPNVVAAYQKYKGKGLEIVGVSLDEDGEQWKAAIKKDGLTWTQTSELAKGGGQVANMYNIQSIPANYLLDKEGKIVASDLRGPALETALAKLMP
jgi:peroxiredoxin